MAITDLGTENEDVRPNKRDARRRAILDAAASLFLTKGYAATSLHDIVRQSGGSLATLYSLFGNKAGLFRELVEERCEAATAVFQDAIVTEQPPEEAMTRFGRLLYTLVTSPEAVGAYRLIVAEGANVPELAETFFAAGPDAGKSRVAKYLAAQHDKGLLHIADPFIAAHQFCSMICAGQDLRLASGLPPLIPPEKVEAHIASAVRTFLRGHASGHPSKND